MDNFQNLSKEELIKLLHQSIAERDEAKAQIETANAERRKAESERDEAKIECNKAKVELDKAKVECDNVKAELAKKMQTLSDIQDIFDKSNEEITHEVDVMNTLIDNYFDKDKYPDRSTLIGNVRFAVNGFLQCVRDTHKYRVKAVAHFTSKSENLKFGTNTNSDNTQQDKSPEEQIVDAAVKASKKLENVTEGFGNAVITITKYQDEEHQQDSEPKAPRKPRKDLGQSHNKKGSNSKSSDTDVNASSKADEVYAKLHEMFDLPNGFGEHDLDKESFEGDNRATKNKPREQNLFFGSNFDLIKKTFANLAKCPYCGKSDCLVNINSSDHNRTLFTKMRSRIDMIEHIASTYKCKNCDKLVTVRGSAEDLVITPNVTNLDDNNQKTTTDLDKVVTNNLNQLKEQLLTTKKLPTQKLTTKELLNCAVAGIYPRGFDINVASDSPFITKGFLTLGLIIDFIRSHDQTLIPWKRIFRDLNIPFSTATAFNAIFTFSRLICHNLVTKLIYPYILSDELVHMDECPVDVREDLNSKECKQYTIWGATNSILSENHYAYYHIDRSHSGNIPSMLLNSEFTKCKYLLTDGTKVYNKVFSDYDDVKHPICWAHLRRYWKDALIELGVMDIYEQIIANCTSLADFKIELEKAYAVEENKTLRYPNAITAICVFFNINCVFSVEHDLNVFDDDYLVKVMELRQTYSKIFVERIFKLTQSLIEDTAFVSYSQKYHCNTYKAANESDLCEAVVYTLNRFDGIQQFLSNPIVPLTNNEQERNFRDIAIKKHSSLFIDTETGCHVLADHFSISRSCILNGVDISEYLTWATYNMLKRYKERDGAQAVVSILKPDYVPVNEIPEQERGNYAIVERLDDKGKSKQYAKIEIYDKRYTTRLDDLDVSGLSIMDYKRQCLKDWL